MADKVINKGDQKCHYSLNKWVKVRTFYIINDMSEYVALVQLMDNLSNVSHYVTTTGA